MLVKPDAVQRRLVGTVIQRFERRGFKLVAMKLLQVPTELPLVPLGSLAQGSAETGVPVGDTGSVSPLCPHAAVRRTGVSWTSTTSSCCRSPSTPRSLPT